jgi:multidrug efflux pump subunit AcrB
MNSTNRKFLTSFGLFWVLTSTLMLITGFWPGLSEFGVSERFFQAMAWLGAVAGVLSILTSVFASRRNP